MATSFPKFYSKFGPGKGYYDELETRGYIIDGFNYKNILYYLSSGALISYSYEIILSDWEKLAAEILDEIEESEENFDLQDLGFNLKINHFNKPTQIERITRKIPERTIHVYASQLKIEIALKLKIVCNTNPGNINIKSTGLKIDIEKIGEKNFFARIIVPYTNSTLKSNPQIDNQPVMIIATSDLETLMHLLNITKFTYTRENKMVIIEIFKRFFKGAGKDRNVLDRIYFLAPDFVLNSLSETQLWGDLGLLLEGNVDESGTNEEAAVLNILSSLCDPSRLGVTEAHNEKATAILDRLINEKAGECTLFELLYDKMNDYGGANNFTALVNHLLVLWTISTYFTSPEHIIYYRTRQRGPMRYDDYNFTLSDDSKTILIEVAVDDWDTSSKEILGTFNTYHRLVLADPGSVSMAEQEFVPEVMPAFYLKAIDDKNFSSRLEVGTFLALDIITTLTGIGNLLKFRHLFGALKKFKVFISAVEVSSGAASIMLTIAEKDDTPFGKKIRTCLFYMDILSLGVDAITSSLLKNSAREAIDLSVSTARTTKNEEMFRLLEDLAGVKQVLNKRPSKYGKIFRVQGGNAPNISKFRFEIKNNKVQIVGDDMLHVTFDDTFRVAQFWTKRGNKAEVFSAEIENIFIEKIKKDAVSQKRALEFPNRPQIDDPTKSKNSFGIPKVYFEELLKSMKNPEIFKANDL